MSWIALVNLPYEGIVASKFEDKSEAKRQYEEDKEQTKEDKGGYYQGVALIEDRVLEEEGYVW